MRYLVVCVALFAFVACDVSQSWAWKETIPVTQPGIRVHVSPPAFLSSDNSSWAPILIEVLQKHPRLVYSQNYPTWLLWAAVDVDSGSALLSLSVRDPAGRLVALLTRESSAYADRQTGRALPDGAENMLTALTEMVHEIFPDPTAGTNGRTGPKS
jgi:hypothetical protein